MTLATAGNDVAKVGSNATALASSRAAVSALLLLWQVVLARELGAELYGVYGTIGAMMAVGAAIPDLGMGVIVVRDVARHPDRAGRYFAASLALHAVLAAVGYGLLQGAAALLGYDASLRALLLFVGVNLLVDALGTAGHNQLIAAERMWSTSAIGTVHVLLLVSLGSAALGLGGHLWAVYGCVFAAGIVRTGLYWTTLRRRGLTPAFPVDGHVARRLLSAGLPLGAAAFLALGFQHADKLVTTAVIGAAATGELTVAFVVVFAIVEMLGTTVLLSVFPQMARARPPGPREIPPLLQPLLHFDVMVGLPAAALIAAFGGDLVTFVFGPAFTGAGPVLAVMGWLVLVRIVEGALAQALTVQDRQTQALAAHAAGLAVNIALTVVLLPRVGLVGAAFGMLAGEMTILAGFVKLLAPDTAWWKSLGRRLGRLALPALALWLCLTMLHGLPVPATAAIAIAAYGGLTLAGGAVTVDQLRALAGGIRWRA
jgi:O-antigen/teichoic acid export membrane protein